MKTLKIVLCMIFLWGGFASVGGATFIEINFDDLDVGDVVTDQYADMGVTFSLLDTSDRYVDGPVAGNINTTNYPGATSPIGLKPGDDGSDPFFDIEILFATSIDYFSFYSFDSDENLTVNGYMDDRLIESVFYPRGSNLQEWHLQIGEIGGSQHINRVVLDVVAGFSGGNAGGPELFDNLSYNTVPEPSTILLMGIGLLAWLVTAANASVKKVKQVLITL
ncbi:PEP-CTERM sorting domain-containing protein [Desulfococcaceae bacterium HSG9]|nr:PEP-CTERM sorting domain-containing protein [Desulfococcaceae bacterium HSG9]